MTIEEQIDGLFIEEAERSCNKQISGFYYTQAEYEGLSVYDILDN
jgi:hypothetical protein